MVGCSNKARSLNAHVLHQPKDVDMSPQIAGAKGSVHCGGVVLVLDDGENLAIVSRANDDRSAKGDVFKGRVDVGHEVAEGHVKAFDVGAVEHGDIINENEVGT